MKDQGVTLIELLVVISVIGILAVALGFSYVGWQGRYKVEKAAKDIHTDLMTARSMAMTRSRDYVVDFPTTTTYRVGEDTNENGAIDAGEPLPTFPKRSEYVFNAFERDDAALTTTAVVITTVGIVFDKRGLISGDALFNPETPTSGIIRLTSTADPDYDCIAVAQTRIAMGKWNGTTSVCDVK
jgi:prepilin-type N-terminal cleavage/methylation domain-containing protein